MKELLLISCLLLAVCPAFAQQDDTDEAVVKKDTVAVKGTISGKVVDDQGRPIPGAEVYVYNGVDIVGSATTDSAGGYLTNRMYIGTYDLVAKYPKYSRQSVEGIEAKAWQDTKQDFTLQPLAVNADTPKVEPVRIIAVPARHPWWRRR